MRDALLDEVRRSVKNAFPDVGDDLIFGLTLDAPRDPSHGDYSSNVAFLLKDLVRDNPRKIAERLVQSLRDEESIGDAEVAGPGFINFRIRPLGVQRFLRTLADPASRRAMMADPEFAARMGLFQVEFVSANPTGPMNVVSARAAAFGDGCVRLLRTIGVDVRSEFYVNDEGNQTRIFGDSLRVRFLQAAGRDAELAEDAYRGDYIAELARALYAIVAALAATGKTADEVAAFVSDRTSGTIAALATEVGSTNVPATDAPAEIVDAATGPAATVPAATVDAVADTLDFALIGINSMVDAAKGSLARFGVEFDSWFRESALHRSEGGAPTRVVEAERLLDERGHVQEKDGARWFTSTEFGDDKDRVIRRSEGLPTYLLGDIAYHLDKAKRGFRHVVNVWGPDHHGYIKRLHSATVALGLPDDWLRVILVQQVNLLRDGQPVKMSKRGGEFVTLDELGEEVGKDVSRFFFLIWHSCTSAISALIWSAFILSRT
jgi:arginyl-tRNA synthetase